MSLIIPEDHALVSFNMTARAGTRPMAFTIGVHNVGLANTDVALDLFEDLLVTPGSIFNGGSFSSDYVYLGISATIGTDTGPVPYEKARFIEGTLNRPPMPPNVAFLVRKRSNRGGKRGRGRFFMPPAWLAEANIDHLGNIDANISTIQSYVDEIYDGLNDQGLEPVLLHAPSLVTPGPVPDPTPITALIVQPKVATQRKRLR